MKRMVWSTDIHMDFLGSYQMRKFSRALLKEKPDVIVFSGDLSNAEEFQKKLEYLEKFLEDIPVYFSCGNHDYYGSSFWEHQAFLKKTYNQNAQSKWLPNVGIVSLTPKLH
jgi:predicted MPP superfamily phosphohydrolase